MVRVPRILTALMGLCFLLIGHVAPRDLFAEAGMLTPLVEEAREMLGLALVVVWMAVLAWRAPGGPPGDSRERSVA